MTREDVIRTLGEVDDTIVAEVISTGATTSDLAVAIERLRAEDATWSRRARSGSRVAALCDVLESWWQASDEPEYYGTD